MAEIINTSRPGLSKVTPTDPEYTVSLIGLVTSVTGQPVVGLVLSIIGLRQSKKAGRSNLLALLGLIFGIFLTALAFLFFAIYVAALAIGIMHNGSID